jgi:trehalose 6-phosphate phosphatase
MSLHAVAQHAGDWALFLDVDGTLLEIAETPQSVHVSDDLRRLLIGLSVYFDGALALVSGRTLADLDHLFTPLRLCAAGVHGCEHREATGCIALPQVDPELLDPARELFTQFVACHDGLLLEDKGYGLALHYRLAPTLAGQVEALVRSVCASLGETFRVQSGKGVFEIRPAAWSKGVSIRAFMNQPPFRNRLPVFIGDDVTDEDGFAVVNELGGISVKVGTADATVAQYRIANVSQVLEWLASLPSTQHAAEPSS